MKDVASGQSRSCTSRPDVNMNPKPHTTSDTTRRVRSANRHERAEQDTIRNCQTEFRQRLRLAAPDVYLVPPDLGDQLYEWWREEREGSTSPSQGATATSLPSGHCRAPEEVEVRKDSEGAPISPTRTKRTRHLSPVPQKDAKRVRISPSVSSAVSEVESIFSSEEQRLDSTSEIANSDYQSAERSPQRTTFTNKPYHPSLSPETLTKPGFPFLPVSAIDDVHLDALSEASRTRPTTFPTAWEKAHPADKMLFSMGREGQDWRAIADSWKEMTGHSDQARHLKWRYEVIEKTMGLQNHGGIEDLYASGTASEPDLGMDLANGWGKKASELLQAAMSGQDQSGAGEVVEMAFETSGGQGVKERSSGVALRLGRKPRPHNIRYRKRPLHSDHVPDRARKDWEAPPVSALQEDGEQSVGEMVERGSDETSWVCLSLPSQKDMLRHVQRAVIARENRHPNIDVTAPPATAFAKPLDTQSPSMFTPPSAIVPASSRLPKLIHDQTGKPTFISHEGKVIELQDPKAERRRNLSEAMRGTWAKRQGEGRNGRYGGVPRLSTITKAEKGSSSSRKPSS